jgi:hypothetical protein
MENVLRFVPGFRPGWKPHNFIARKPVDSPKLIVGSL